MKSNLLFILLLSFLLLNPKKSLCQSSQVNCIKNLKNEIRINWEQFIDNRKYYRTSKKFITKLDSIYRDCIIGLSKDELISLFGKPTGTGVDRFQKKYSVYFRYTINYTCSEQSDRSCPQILLDIIGDTIVGDFRIIYSGLSDVYFTSTKKCLNKLTEIAKSDWIYHPDVNVYENKNDFLYLLEGSRSWLVNEVTDKQIEEILGVPTKIDKSGSKYYYYSLYPCKDENKLIEETGEGCRTYCFAFSIVTHILYGFTESFPIRMEPSH